MSQDRPEVSVGRATYARWRWPATAALVAIALGTQSLTLQAGSQVMTVDTTGNRPSSVPGHVLGRAVGVRWDVRSLPVKYSMNTTQDPIPNPAGDPVLVNEINFQMPSEFGVLAYSTVYAFTYDTPLVDGDDLDEDGDSDVSMRITVSKDVDGDGDLELPVGLYKAGTIVDNDVEFNTSDESGTRFTVNDADIDRNQDSADLMAVAVHEFGHSHGLAHSALNQVSAADGRGACMFPYLDTTDPTEERNLRTLSTDDIAWSSYIYPEGTAAHGPAALQPGDVKFRSVYGLIAGTITHGVYGVPVAGAHVYAVDDRGDRIVASAISGTTQVSVDPETGVRYASTFEENILDGRYAIPVPKGRYAVGIEAIDGSPAHSYEINLTAMVGDIYGLMDFHEEFFDRREDDVEARPGAAKPVLVLPGVTRQGVDLVTPRTFTISPFGDVNTFGYSNATPGYYYAVRVPAEIVAAINPDEDILTQSVQFYTLTRYASAVPVFEEAILTTGVVNADGTASNRLSGSQRHRVVTGGICDQATAMSTRRVGASRLRHDDDLQLRPGRRRVSPADADAPRSDHHARPAPSLPSVPARGAPVWRSGRW